MVFIANGLKYFPVTVIIQLAEHDVFSQTILKNQVKTPSCLPGCGYRTISKEFWLFQSWSCPNGRFLTLLLLFLGVAIQQKPLQEHDVFQKVAKKPRVISESLQACLALAKVSVHHQGLNNNGVHGRTTRWRPRTFAKGHVKEPEDYEKNVLS